MTKSTRMSRLESDSISPILCLISRIKTSRKRAQNDVSAARTVGGMYDRRTLLNTGCNPRNKQLANAAVTPLIKTYLTGATIYTGI